MYLDYLCNMQRTFTNIFSCVLLLFICAFVINRYNVIKQFDVLILTLSQTKESVGTFLILWVNTFWYALSK